jgi:ABC-2 type transport system ATP-binding protein
LEAVDSIVIAIETSGLSREFGARLAVDDLNLEVTEGSVFGFLGPNGAGKTTTVRMLTALIAPTRGTATVGGYVVGKQDKAIRQSVGILTETPGLYDRLSAYQNLMYFARLYEVSSKQAASAIEHHLRLLDLWDRRDEKVGGFSKGMRQKLAIVRAVLHHPRIVFLDEPTSGLDPEATRIVRDFIKELRGEGRTIFLTTHNLPEAEELCDLVGVFKVKLMRVGAPASLGHSLFGRGTIIRVVGPASTWMEEVRQLPFVHQVTARADFLDVILADPDSDNPALVRCLVNAGADLREVRPKVHSLEEAYLELLDQGRAASAASSSPSFGVLPGD